jgi:hypothetical protein
VQPAQGLSYAKADNCIGRLGFGANRASSAPIRAAGSRRRDEQHRSAVRAINVPSLRASVGFATASVNRRSEQQTIPLLRKSKGAHVSSYWPTRRALLRFLQVGGVEAFGEPVVDRK